jgi:glycerophosphoryl diester phosphodiesterase
MQRPVMRPLQVLAHRGFWLEPAEKNAPVALARAISSGFGIETDVRDRDGDLVISHDPARGSALTFSSFLELFPPGFKQPLALNIKADGLQRLLVTATAQRPDLRFYTFDMSVPDALGYARAGVPFLTRESEYEQEPTLLDRAAGVWMDQFEGDWIGLPALERHLKHERTVCVVSPELHGRDFQGFWRNLRAALADLSPGGGEVALCTDHPMRAREYFQ